MLRPFVIIFVIACPVGSLRIERGEPPSPWAERSRLPIEKTVSAGASKNCLVFTDEFKRGEHSLKSIQATYESNEWVEARPPEIKQVPPKLAVLMFAKNTLINSDLWLEWLENAKQTGQSYKFLIHAYGINTPGEFQVPSLRDNVFTHLAPTQWCDIWEVQMELLERALMDSDVTHFAIVSDDSLPLKPLKDIHAELLLEPRTRMCADDDWNRAETWWLMRRGDAELFRWFRSTIERDFVHGCTEESSWYFPLKLRMERWGARLGVLDSCPMFTYWKHGGDCKKWSDHADTCNCPHLQNHVENNATSTHPASFARLGAEALRELRASPFWFGRKFERTTELLHAFREALK